MPTKKKPVNPNEGRFVQTHVTRKKFPVRQYSRKQVTVPDQVLPIKERLERYANNRDVVFQTPLPEGTLNDLPNIESMSKMEIADYYQKTLADINEKRGILQASAKEKAIQNMEKLKADAEAYRNLKLSESSENSTPPPLND